MLDVLKNPEEDVEVRSKALYAVSGNKHRNDFNINLFVYKPLTYVCVGTIKNYSPGLAQFEEEGGYEILLNLLSTSNGTNASSIYYVVYS